MLKGLFSSNALLHLIGGDEKSKGIAGAVVDTVKEEQSYNRDLIKESAKTVIQERLEEKKRRKQIVESHKANLDMLKSSGYNIDNSLSIAKAGMTDKMLEWAAEYRGDVDGVKDVNKLWTFHGNSVAKSNLTHRELAERIAGPEMFAEVQYGDLEPSNSFLSAIGIPQKIGKRIQQTVDAIAPLPAAKEMEALNISGVPSAILASQVTNEQTATRPTYPSIDQKLAELTSRKARSLAGDGDWTEADEKELVAITDVAIAKKDTAMGWDIRNEPLTAADPVKMTILQPLFTQFFTEQDIAKQIALGDEFYKLTETLGIPQDHVKFYMTELAKKIK